MLREATDGFREVLGEEHPYTGIAMLSLADALLQLDRISEAEALAIETRTRREDRHGPNHEQTREAEELLARIRQAQGSS